MGDGVDILGVVDGGDGGGGFGMGRMLDFSFFLSYNMKFCSCFVLPASLFAVNSLFNFGIVEAVNEKLKK